MSKLGIKDVQIRKAMCQYCFSALADLVIFCFPLTLSQHFFYIFHQILHNDNYVNELNNDQIMVNRFNREHFFQLVSNK